MSDRVKTASWGLAVYAGTRVIGSVLESASLASTIAQAVLAEWGTGRLGVTWSDPDVYRDPPTATEMAKRAARGAVAGLVPAAAVVALLVATHGVILERSAATAASLGVAIVGAAVTSMRDELVLHGVIFRMMLGEKAWMKAIACGVTSGAAAIGEKASVRAVVVQALLGVVFGALWGRDKGAWMAWGAHTAWLMGTSLVLAGGFYSASNAATSWGGGNAGPLGGDAAILALIPFAIVAVASGRKTT